MNPSLAKKHVGSALPAAGVKGARVVTKAIEAQDHKLIQALFSQGCKNSSKRSTHAGARKAARALAEAFSSTERGESLGAQLVKYLDSQAV